MNVIAFILALAAAVVFLLVPENRPLGRAWVVAPIRLGLFLLASALIVQFTSTHHQIRF